MTSEAPRFISLKQVAKRYGLSYITVANMAKDGRIPAFKVGGRGVWRVDLKLLEQREQEALRGV